MSTTQNINSYILSRILPHGNPWSGDILAYSSGSTPLTTFDPSSSKGILVTNISVYAPDGFEVGADGEIRIFWGTNTYERISFSNNVELALQCDEVKASGHYVFKFFPQTGSSPIMIKATGSQNVSIGCYNSGGSLDESAALSQSVKFSVRGVQQTQSRLP